MKKLLLILLCLPMIGFGQELGDLIEINYNERYLYLKNPLGCENIEQPGNIVTYLCGSSMIGFKLGPIDIKGDDDYNNSQFKDSEYIENFISGFEADGTCKVYKHILIKINGNPALKFFYNTTDKISSEETFKGIVWYVAYGIDRIIINSMYQSNEYSQMSHFYSMLANSVDLSLMKKVKMKEYKFEFENVD